MSKQKEECKELSELVKIAMLKNNIAQAIQSSELSEYIVNAVLKDFCTESNMMVEQMMMKEMELYNSSMKQENKL